MKIKSSEFIRQASKIVHEWNGHLEVALENSRQYLLLRTVILQKTVVECPCVSLTSGLQPLRKFVFLTEVAHSILRKI